MSRVFCGWCMDRGCLACDAHRAARIQQREEEARLKRFLMAVQDEMAGQENDIDKLLTLAIRYGEQEERRRNQAMAETSKLSRGRFDWLEIGDSDASSDQS